MKRFCLWLLFVLLFVGGQLKATSNNGIKRVEITSASSISSQLRFADTYYVIKDLIDLKGSTITVPKGCTFKMEGGQFANGQIIGNNTYIDSSPYPIFSKTLKLNGSFVASEAYPEWFEGDDDAIKIRKSLDCFDNVLLTSKQYVLKSVDENGYGVVVPEGHILRGNRRANNTNSDDQVIKIADGLNYTSVIALNSSTVLSDLTVRGANNGKAACISTVEGFQSRLTIERVGVSGAFYGFNLQAYLANINQCVANYNEIGFYIHGKIEKGNVKVEGTSINVSTCFAVDSKKIGYELTGITYSTLNNCAADGCGAPTSGLLQNKTEIGCGYSLTQCKCLTINSCGVENGLAAVNTISCRNIIFNAPSFLINKRNEVKVAKD